jgi:cob(I)alamin adenosyltransferase
MKGKTNYGELEAIKRIPEISILQFGTEDFVMKGKEQEIDYREARAALKRAGEAMKDPGLSILVLDEINVALFFQLIKPEDVIELVKSRPPGLELVLTGRRIPQEIKDLADLVTNFVEEKHYYSSQGLQARQGIEH